MDGSLQAPPIVVRGSRRRGAWLVAGSVVFVACGAVEFGNGQRLVALFTVAFFGLCGVIGLWTLIAPNNLQIAPSGITQRMLWRTRRFAWADIYNFRATTIGLTSKTVGFDFLKPRPGREGLRKFNAAVAGVQGSLGPGWEIDSISLAALLNQAREQWLEAPAPADVAPAAPSMFSGLAGNRLDRKTYLVASALLFALSVGLGFLPVGARGASGVLTFFFIRLYAARLHDLGRSGWWQLALYGTQIVVLVGVLAVGLQPVDFAVGAAFLIQLLFTAGLGLFPGEPGENRFGPAPGEPTAALQAEVFR